MTPAAEAATSRVIRFLAALFVVVVACLAVVGWVLMGG